MKEHTTKTTHSMRNSLWKSVAVAASLACCFGMGATADVVAQKTVSTETKVSEKNQFKISGKVVNSSTRVGFAGARISAVNTRITAMTDEKGNFSLGLPSGKITLVVEAPGFHKQIVPVKDREIIDINLLEDNGHTFYDETMFMPNGANSVTKFSTGLTAINEDLTARLNGQLRVLSQSGIPGSGSTVFIRGLNSINSSAQPLYVVDGVIWEMQENGFSSVEGFSTNPLALMEPNDIEKITVLKDATAIYGSKGANGVILIETKRSRDMATEIEAFVNFGYRAPFKTIPVMDAKAFRLYASDIIQNKENIDLKELDFLNDDPTNPYYRSSHNTTNWFDEVNQGAFYQNYGVNVRGGDNIALYSFSMGYTANDGNLENTDFNRLNVRFNSDINLMKNFKIALDIAFAQTINHQVTQGINEVKSPYYMSMIKSPLYHKNQYDTNGNTTKRLSDTDELNIGNPLSILDNPSNMKKYRFNANVNPTYKFGDKVELSALFGYAWDKATENAFTPNKGVADVPLYNDNGEVYATALNEVRNLASKQISTTFDMRATYNILKDDVNNLKLFAGYRFYNDIYDYTFGRGYNTASDMPGLEVVSSSLRFTLGENLHQKSVLWYLNGDYSLYNRYIFNVAASIESSSRFGKQADGLKMAGVPWGFFPSVSGAWIVSSESFMRDVEFINFLKLRLNYSVSGNDNIVDYARNSYFQSTHFLGGAYGLTLANIGNEKLKWETTSTAKVGVDLSLFNNRWTVNADFYLSNTNDLLTRKNLNDVAGVKYFWSNDGELENKGFEIATNVRILDAPKWKLDFGAMIGRYKNTVKSLANGSYTTTVAGGEILTAEGQPAGMFYGYKTNGVFATSEEARQANLSIVSPSGALIPFEAGDMRFVDLNGDNKIDQKDRQIIGDPNPDVYGNFNLNLSYKGLTVGALFSYSYGNDAYNALRANLESGSDLFNQSEAMQNRWVANGQKTDMPKAMYGDPMGNARFSDRWIEDASYLRLKSFTVSYKIPIKSSFIQGLSVWASANNLWTFTNYLGSDPEFSYGSSVLYQGVDAGMIPMSQSFNFGVKINL